MCIEYEYVCLTKIILFTPFFSHPSVHVILQGDKSCRDPHLGLHKRQKRVMWSFPTRTQLLLQAVFTFSAHSPLPCPKETAINPLCSFLFLLQATMAIFFNANIFLLTSLALLLFTPLSLSSSSSIRDLLRSKGLPPGLLPKEIKSYTFSEDGHLEVFLNGPCLTKFENRVLFDSVVRANLTYGSLIGVEGLSQEELFLWLPVKDIIVDDPRSGLILFDIGLAHKQLSLSLFEDPPRCKPQGH